MIENAQDMEDLMENDEGFQIFFSALVEHLKPKIKIIAAEAVTAALRDARDSG